MHLVVTISLLLLNFLHQIITILVKDTFGTLLDHFMQVHRLV